MESTCNRSVVSQKCLIVLQFRSHCNSAQPLVLEGVMLLLIGRWMHVELLNTDIVGKTRSACLLSALSQKCSVVRHFCFHCIPVQPIVPGSMVSSSVGVLAVHSTADSLGRENQVVAIVLAKHSAQLLAGFGFTAVLLSC